MFLSIADSTIVVADVIVVAIAACFLVFYTLFRFFVCLFF